MIDADSVQEIAGVFQPHCTRGLCYINGEVEMRVLNENEMHLVDGAGIIGDAWDDIKRIAEELPGFYDSLINSTTDMMCRATSNC